MSKNVNETVIPHKNFVQNESGVWNVHKEMCIDLGTMKFDIIIVWCYKYLNT